MSLTSPPHLLSEILTPWQMDVREFHLCLHLETGDYARPQPLTGDTLALRARLVDEECCKELSRALNAGDVVEIVDSLLDTAYVVLGSFDVAGLPARDRYQTLIETGMFRGWKGFTMDVTKALWAVFFAGAGVVESMRKEHNRGWSFQSFEMLDDLMIKVASAFTIMGIDPRPLWAEVHASNLRKAGGPIVEGKQRKPPVWMAPKIRELLQAQGASL